MSADASDSLGELLSAYLDDEVTADERAQVERLLANDPAARALYAELRATAEAVRELPAPAAPPDVLAGIMPRLERETLLAGSGREVTLARHRRPPVRATLAVAAMLAVALGGGLFVSLKLSERPEETRLALRQPAEEDAPALRKPRLDVRPQAASPAPGEAGRNQGIGAPAALPAADPASAPASETPPARSVDTNLFSKSTRDALSELGITPLAVPPTDTTGEAAAEAAPEPLASAASLPEQFDDETEMADLAAAEMAKTSSATAPTALPSPAITNDARTFEQRLAAGEDPAELATHDFANEPLRLSIHFRSPAGAERFSQRVQRLLASRSVPALADVAGSAAPAAPTPLRAPLVVRAAEAAIPPNRRLLYVVGAPGANFNSTATGEQQLLARIPADWIDDLIDETVATDAAATELQLGGLAAQGPADARALAQTIVTPAPPMAFARATVEEDEESQWLGGLKELVHNLAAVAHPQDEGEAKGLPAVAARGRIADTNGIDADSASTVGLELATAQRAAGPAPSAGRLLAANEAPAADAAVMELARTPALAPSGSDVVTIVLDVSVEPAPTDVGTNG